MAIETRTINGTLTELYITGGGSFMTQAKATHFHDFWTRKILAPSESIDDFKEVTAAEKAKLEAADAAWERPPQSFIDAWNTRADYTSMNKAYKFGQYNEETGYFELNKILDIDYPEAREIMAQSDEQIEFNGGGFISTHNKIRTVMPTQYGYDRATIVISGDMSVQTLQLFSYYGDWLNFNNTTNKLFCTSSFALRSVFGQLRVQNTANFSAPKLEEIYAVSVTADGAVLGFGKCPLLSLESINYTIENSTKTLTIILHPDAYARITEDMFEKAATKGITITSA